METVMQKFTQEEIKDACGGEYLCRAEETGITSVAIDSRKVLPGALFVPIKGERTDGHEYISKAFELGAAASLTERREKCPGGTLIYTENTVDAIGEIAKAYKKKYNVPTVGITGSVGKTSTKDMVAAVMSKKFCCLKTQGNFNNELGLPLTVFELEKEHGAAVLEMGMSAFGEIHRLADIARPDVGVITNIGMSHIENLSSREGILKAKMEICDFFTPESLLVINGDNDMLKTINKDAPYKIVTYGIESEGLDIRAEDIEDFGLGGCSFTAKIADESYKIRVNAAGVHNVYNALAAIAVGRHYGIKMQDIAEAIAEFELTAMRMTVDEADGIVLINDCYNASPDSIKASLKVLKTAKGRRVAVLGDVLELGDYAHEAHLSIGRMCEGCADVVICAGDNAKYIAECAKDCAKEVHYFPTTALAAEYVKDFVKSGDTVLVKASRGMHFEDICKAIRGTK